MFSYTIFANIYAQDSVTISPNQKVLILGSSIASRRLYITEEQIPQELTNRAKGICERLNLEFLERDEKKESWGCICFLGKNSSSVAITFEYSLPGSYWLKNNYFLEFVPVLRDVTEQIETHEKASSGVLFTDEKTPLIPATVKKAFRLKKFSS
jgi:hypothetical protein